MAVYGFWLSQLLSSSNANPMKGSQIRILGSLRSPKCRELTAIKIVEKDAHIVSLWREKVTISVPFASWARVWALKRLQNPLLKWQHTEKIRIHVFAFEEHQTQGQIRKTDMSTSRFQIHPTTTLSRIFPLWPDLDIRKVGPAGAKVFLDLSSGAYHLLRRAWIITEVGIGGQWLYSIANSSPRRMRIQWERQRKVEFSATWGHETGTSHPNDTMNQCLSNSFSCGQ